MVNDAIENAGIIDLMDKTLSVDMVKVCKPHTDLCRIVPDLYDVDFARVCFMSSNAWDAAAEVSFSFEIFGINRFSQLHDKISWIHENMLPTSEDLPALLGL